MLAIEFTFSAGRYHANPWGRHVNEADVAWPPDPWRIVRAFIAVWHRKIDPAAFSREVLASLLAKLSRFAPRYRLPKAVHAHTRHYMPVIEGANEKRTLVFDAFARVQEPLVVTWPECSLSEDETMLLDALLASIGYLGRAESWVEARRLDGWQGTCNCVPGEDRLEAETGELRDAIALLKPKAPDCYAAFRAAANATHAGMSKKDRAMLATTLPQDWVEALSVDTSQLQEVGWSAPPAADKIYYLRPADALQPAALRPLAPSCTSGVRPTTARFALYGKPMPRLEDALRVGEWARRAIQGRSKWTLGEDRIPPVLSGHGLPQDNRHGHAFYLPEDADGDGRLDHLLVHAPLGFDQDAIRVLADLAWLKGEDGRKLQVLLENLGAAAIFSSVSGLCRKSAVWESITPYLHPWHIKKTFGVLEQLRRECAERSIRAELLSVERLDVGVGGRRAVDFARFRHKRGLTQPDTRGGFWRLIFDEPILGPLALGFGCHFGLGMFAPAAPE